MEALPKAVAATTNAAATLISSQSGSNSCSVENLRRTLPNVFSARERLEAYERELELMTPLLVHKLPSCRAD